MTSGRRARAMREQQRRKRHHLDPAMYLEAWADDRKMVRLIDQRSGKGILTNVSNATVRSNFYTVTTSEGTQSDVVERIMGEVEGKSADALRQLRQGMWPPSQEVRRVVANLIALQIGRSPQLRSGITDGFRRAIELGDRMKSEMDRIRTEDPERYRTMVENQSRLNGLVNDGPGMPLEELRNFESTIAMDSLVTSAGLVEPIGRMTWTLLEAGEGQFLTGDHPVVHWPHPDQPAFYGTGLFTAVRTTFPIAPRYCLELTISDDPDALASNQPLRIIDVDEVDEINSMTARHADTHAVMHPSIGWIGEPPWG